MASSVPNLIERDATALGLRKTFPHRIGTREHKDKEKKQSISPDKWIDEKMDKRIDENMEKGSNEMKRERMQT